MKEKTTPADENHPHSIFGASGAKTWRTCPGSPQAIATAKLLGDIPEETTSAYAEEGTEAHSWAEKVLTGQADVSEIPDKMRVYVEGFVDVCKKSIEGAKKAGGKIIIEGMVPLFYRTQDVGTLDFASYVIPTKELKGGLHLIDYKHGVGVHNPAEDNDQLAIYGISLINEIETNIEGTLPDEMPVALCIYQPRHHLFDGLDAWNLTVRDLKDIAIDIEADYEKAQDGAIVDLVPSDGGCMFCDLKTVCSARGQTSFGGLPPEVNPFEDFDDETAPVKTLAIKKAKKGELTFTPAQIAFICANGASIKKVVDDVIKGERGRIEAGGDLRGMKLIGGGLKPRTWVDEDAAEKLIKNKLGAAEAYHPRKFLTAPQALAKLENEELSTKFQNKLDSLVHRPPGNPKLVPVSDKGEALVFTTIEEDFEDEVETPEAGFEDLM